MVEQSEGNGVLPMKVTAWLFAVTLVYLVIEAAFNARLLDVLGATQGDLASPEAIAGLEFWGRVISSIAVGLALGTAHASQRFHQRAPFPLNLLDKRVREWKGERLAQSVAIILLAMTATFLLERSIIDNEAERQDPVSLWWSHYGARATDLGGLGLSYIASDPERTRESEEAIATEYEKKGILVPPPVVADLASADSKTFIAILPHSLQNYARQQPRSASDSRPYTAMEIQTQVNEGFLETITEITARDSRNAILVPVRRCFEMLYDQSPPYETKAPDYELPVARCLSRNATVSSFVGDLPPFLNRAVDRCFSAPAIDGARYADYVSLNCTFSAAEEYADEQSRVLSDIYLEEYVAARTEAMRGIRADPARLPDNIQRQIKTRLSTMIFRATARLNVRQRRGLFNPATDALPPCGSLQDRLLSRFVRHYSRQGSAQWLRGKESEYCRFFDELLPSEPEPSGSELFAELQPEFAERIGQRISDTGTESVTFQGGLPTVVEFQQDVSSQIVGPVRDRLDQVLQSQFAAIDETGTRLPRVGQYASLDEFFGNPTVSSLARGSLQELSDSTFQCVGIPRVAESVEFRGSLRSISSDWDRQFHRKATRELERNGVASRFTGLLSDFTTGKRCHAAGVSSYHRATMPGTALLISMAGLLFHASKLVYYLGVMLGFGLRARFGLVFAALGLMLAAPLSVNSKLLVQPSAKTLIEAYETSHGASFANGVRWLIRAELLLYPLSNSFLEGIFLPLGLDFTRDTDNSIAEARAEQISRVCGKVPQIAESAEYETLKAFLTNRTFCDTQ